MKYSIILGLVFSLATASPLQGRPQADANLSARGTKKPFLEPASLRDIDKACGSGNAYSGVDAEGTSEACLGTTVFCQNGNFARAGETFATAEECINSRVKAPSSKGAKPTKAPAKLFKAPAGEDQEKQLCGTNNGHSSFSPEARSEECLGTQAFCTMGLFKETSESFTSADQCMNSRAKKPFLEPVSKEQSDKVCGSLSGPSRFNKEGISEACVGTEIFCLEGFYRDFSENFADAENCFNSRSPGSDAISFPSK